MQEKRSNTKIGNEVEKSFIRLLKKNKAVVESIRSLYGIKEDLTEAHPTGTNQKKSDALLLFNSFSLGVNIKASKNAYNPIFILK